MSDLTIQGEVKEILKPESGTSKAGKDWNKQDFVIKTNDQYPRLVCFTLFGDKTDLISNISVGETVDVSFNLESREYNGRYFHNVNAWKVLKVENSQSEPQNESHEPEPENADDLPF